jgi:hypothetical protein
LEVFLDSPLNVGGHAPRSLLKRVVAGVNDSQDGDAEGDVVVGSGRMEIGAEEVRNLSSGKNAGHGFPLAAGRWPCQRS